MRKMIIFPLLLILLTGCIETSLRYEPTTELKERYSYSSKDSNLTILYNVTKSGSETVLSMAVRNTGGIFMKNLTINYDECCQTLHKGPGIYNYQNLGNLKNRSHKLMTLKIPSTDVQTVKLTYSFTPVKEDSFLNASDSYTPAADADSISSVIMLYIDK